MAGPMRDEALPADERTFLDLISEQRIRVSKLSPSRQGTAWAQWLLSLPVSGDMASWEAEHQLQLGNSDPIRTARGFSYQALKCAVEGAAMHPAAMRNFIKHAELNDDRFARRVDDWGYVAAVRSRIRALYKYEPLLGVVAAQPDRRAVTSLVNWMVRRVADDGRSAETILDGLENVPVEDLAKARYFVSGIINSEVRGRVRSGLAERRKQYMVGREQKTHSMYGWVAKIAARTGLDSPDSIAVFPANLDTTWTYSPEYWDDEEARCPVVVDLRRYPVGFRVKLGPELGAYSSAHRIAFAGEHSLTGLAELVRALPGKHNVIISGDHAGTMAQFARFLKRPDVSFSSEVPAYLLNVVQSVRQFTELTGIDRLAELAEHDPFMVWGAQDMRQGTRAWALDGAVAVLSNVLWKNRLFVRGEAAEAVNLVQHLITAEGARVDRVWAEFGLTEHLISKVPWLEAHETDWEMHTRMLNRDRPPLPDGAEVKWFRGADLFTVKERRALLSKVLRYSYSRTPAPVDVWAQVYTPEGQLASVAASAWPVRGVGFISAVGTEPKLRRDQHPGSSRRNYGGRAFHEILERTIDQKGEAMLLVGTGEKSEAARTLYQKYGMERRLMMSATVGARLGR